MPRLPFFAALAAISATPAMAAPTILLDTGFDAENLGAGQLNYNGFAQFTVEGTVDLIRSGDYGIACRGGSGSCVDLDGSGSGRLVTRDSYSVAAGDMVVLSFDLRGNGRDPSADPFQAGFRFDAPFSATGVQGTGPAGSGYNSGIGDFAGDLLFQSLGGLPSDAPWGSYSLRFTAAAAGSFRAYLGTSSNDAYGPILDNVRITRDAAIAAVPEPATWATMTLGFGLVGGAIRRRDSRRSVSA